jgi:hypothetical protein
MTRFITVKDHGGQEYRVNLDHIVYFTQHDPKVPETLIILANSPSLKAVNAQGSAIDLQNAIREAWGPSE